MNAATVDLLNLGFELASRVFDIIEADREADSARQVEQTAEMSALIQSSATRLGNAVREAAERVVTKLETDKLEELQSRTRNLSMLVRMKRPGEVLQYTLQLRESVDYAHNRLREGKDLWLGPWLAGHAMVMAALVYSGTFSPEELATFEEEVQQARTRVLELARPWLLASPAVPWEEVAAFVRGESTVLLRRLLAQDAGAGLPPGQAGRGEAEGERTPPAPEEVAARAAVHLKDCVNTFLSPAIPDKKLRGARGALMKRASDSELVIGLIDTTVFGGCEEGVALLADRFYFKELAQEPVWLPYSAIQGVRVEGGAVFVETALKTEAAELNPDNRFGAVMQLVVADLTLAHGLAAFFSTFVPPDSGARLSAARG
ncbi:hypothetical protein [Pyxidicoccus xibeiensis]|uniref:hypothetical protein n=1 Tax=Pyxidicoccus xibeiensis TaxID=2906759 RepID=UPI0020A7DEF2|nr:hypothetical protein [Pyxidicoccus xibeiensis]MCP3136611.1 hypothetical protein [Pyxidicoccus xibeiensis]